MALCSRLASRSASQPLLTHATPRRPVSTQTEVVSALRTYSKSLPGGKGRGGGRRRTATAGVKKKPKQPKGPKQPAESEETELAAAVAEADAGQEVDGGMAAEGGTEVGCCTAGGALLHCFPNSCSKAAQVQTACWQRLGGTWAALHLGSVINSRARGRVVEHCT